MMNMLLKAESLMRGQVEICLQIWNDIGHEHSHMEADVDNYSRLLQQMGLDNTEIDRKISEILN